MKPKKKWPTTEALKWVTSAIGRVLVHIVVAWILE